MSSQFIHFPTSAIKFLCELEANNSRDWFHANKKTYEQVLKQPAQEFCATFSQRLLMLTGIEHEHKIFRINRDIRFSKDKTPYNTHLRISFFPMQNTNLKPGWHFSLETQRMIFGTGIFAIEKEQLDILRHYIAGKGGKQLSSIMTMLRSQNVRIGEPELKRVPKPFAPDHQHATLLRHKSFSAWIDFDDPQIATQSTFIDTLISKAEILQPLNNWLSEVK